MSILYNIRSVAKYESKLLTRSWFYRIFLILSVSFLAFFNIVTMLNSEGDNFWLMKAIAANIPYVNLLFLNTGQAIIAVFLSSEFLKTDKKLDTSEVFYVHPLSNAEYVIGKIWGNMRVFIRLDMLIIAIVVVLNIASGVAVDWAAYAAYFLLICVPTLVYIFGLSVGCMLMLKNQAVTFVLLLGYIALTLFYIGDKFYYVFDYMVYALPLMKSSIVGFTNAAALINHRCIYLLLGLGFICVSIFLFRRIPNTRYGRFRWLVMAALFLSGGGWAAYNHIRSILHESQMRAIYTEVNNRYVHTPKLIIDSYDIDVKQHTKTFSSEVSMKGVAEKTASVFTFCLNPALTVRAALENGRNLKFERDHQILLVDFGRQITPRDTTLFTIKYDGYIDDGFCYLDIPDEILQQKYANIMFRIDKRYSFQNADYLLFTPETYWYPRAGTSYSSTSPDWQQVYFSHFRLNVTTLNNLQALSQGTMTVIDTGHVFTFETDFPSPTLSLIAGDYEQKSITVDSTLYSVWYLKGHDYFTSAFDSIIDTLPSQLRERRRSIESNYLLDYSFKRFSLVETPVQFFSYARTWTQAQEKMQPEMTLFPEKGCLFNESDVATRTKLHKKWSKWGGRDVSDNDAAMYAFNDFLWIFQRTESNFNWSQERGVANISAQSNPYFIFPQLYNFRYNIFSPEWTIANRLVELYLQDKSDNNTWMRQMNGISNNEKANLLMEQYPFKELLSSVEHRDLLDNVISLKANYLFAPAERNIGYKEYRDSLRAVLQRNIFKNIRFEDLLDTLGAISGEDLHAPLEAWNSPTPLPVYIVGDPEAMQITNRDKDAYVLKLQITNDSDYEGILNVETNTGGGRGGNRNDVYDPRTKRKVSFAPHETKKLVSVWDEAPRNININTLISANLPNIINLPVNSIVRERNRPVDAEGDFVISEVSYQLPGEVIVDNEDSLLFVLSKPDVVGLLPKWLDQVDNGSFRYSGVWEWRPPLQWTLTTNDKYYGTYIRSAYAIKSGNGKQTATWKIPVPAPGYYDLHYHVYKPNEWNRGWRRGGDDAEYRFKVKYNDNEENAYINTKRANEGWNVLGSYYFDNETDTVHVVLSNECKLNIVTADAVKIVRR